MTKKLVKIFKIFVLTLILSLLCKSCYGSGKLEELKPEYRQRAKDFIVWIQETYPDHKVVVAEVYRSQERQDKLYAKGSHVTQVRVSKHTMRKAMDIYFVNYKRILKPTEAPYAEIGAEWERRGNIWGGSWKTLYDPGHFEF